jgi:hypothetical protein
MHWLGTVEIFQKSGMPKMFHDGDKFVVVTIAFESTTTDVQIQEPSSIRTDDQA